MWETKQALEGGQRTDRRWRVIAKVGTMVAVGTLAAAGLTAVAMVS